MRLRSVWVSQYKNLRDFSLSFDGDGFIDIFVGKNGSGKSNFLEALIEIFDHLFESQRDGGRGRAPECFPYKLSYEIGGDLMEIELGEGGIMMVNFQPGTRTQLTQRLPDAVLVYYSGQNDKVGALISGYEDRYRRRLRTARETTLPNFVGIGPACKKLLIVVMLLLPEENLARQYLCAKLGIIGNRRTVRINLKRPYFAAAGDHDPFEEAERFWGAQGPVRTFLDQLLGCIEGEFTPGSLYDREADKYVLNCNLDALREGMGEDASELLFLSFDALRIVGMLDDIGIAITLEGLEVSELNHFSDGQFQSVYVFAVSEIFKRRNCLTLLDEPDAFLHPEWQFDFLDQVTAISAEAARTNHILLSSHSASTVAAKCDNRIRLFSSGAGGVTTEQPEKSTIVRSLSAGLITFSETEASLNIEQLLKNNNRPVLFTEGVSDAEIVEVAWRKLHIAQPCPFDVIQGFDRHYLRNLLTRDEIYQKHDGRLFFGLFDFDEAYDDWAGVGNLKAHQVATGGFEQPIVEQGLVCQRAGKPGYAILLPVPNGLSIRGQVCNPNTGQTYGGKSSLPIELLFHDVPGLEAHFAVDPEHPAGWRRFIGSKVHFAQEVVPGLNAAHFEAFRPVFDFIIGRIGAA